MTAWRGQLLFAVVVAAFGSIVIGGLMSGHQDHADRALADSAPCEMPRPKRGVREAKLPDIVRFRGGETLAVERQRGFISADVNVAMSVRDTFDALKRRVRGSDLRILQLDFEGFEAELYITLGNRAGVLQITRSQCSGTSRLLVQLPVRS
jgi:hypothetical protein